MQAVNRRKRGNGERGDALSQGPRVIVDTTWPELQDGPCQGDKFERAFRAPPKMKGIPRTQLAVVPEAMAGRKQLLQRGLAVDLQVGRHRVDRFRGEGRAVRREGAEQYVVVVVERTPELPFEDDLDLVREIRWEIRWEIA